MHLARRTQMPTTFFSETGHYRETDWSPRSSLFPLAGDKET